MMRQIRQDTFCVLSCVMFISVLSCGYFVHSFFYTPHNLKRKGYVVSENTCKKMQHFLNESDLVSLKYTDGQFIINRFALIITHNFSIIKFHISSSYFISCNQNYICVYNISNPLYMTLPTPPTPSCHLFCIFLIMMNQILKTRQQTIFLSVIVQVKVVAALSPCFLSSFFCIASFFCFH